MKTILSSSGGSQDVANQGITCPDIILGFGHAATVPTTPPGPPRGRRNIVLHIREVWGKSKISSSEIDFFRKTTETTGTSAFKSYRRLRRRD